MIEIYTDEKANRQPLEKYGIKHQSLVWCEECSELIKSITKIIRAPEESTEPNRYEYLTNNVIEEMADVLICIDQIKLSMGITNKDLQKVVDLKQNREAKRNGSN